MRLYKCNKQINDVSSANTNNLISDKIELENKAKSIIETLKKDNQLDNFKNFIKIINKGEPFNKNDIILEYFLKSDLIENGENYYVNNDIDIKLKLTEKGILIKDNI